MPKSTNINTNNKKINVNINVTKQSSPSSTIKFVCNYCNKDLASRQSKWRHQKTCTNKTNFEKRLEELENKMNSNIDINFIIQMMNINIQSIKQANTLIDTLYYNESLKKISSHIKQIVSNNIAGFLLLAQNKNNFDIKLKNQVNFNLAIIKKLKSYHENIEYQNNKLYLFRNHTNNLKEITIHTTNEPNINSEEILYYDPNTDELIHKSPQIKTSQINKSNNFKSNNFKVNDSDIDSTDYSNLSDSSDNLSSSDI